MKPRIALFGTSLVTASIVAAPLAPAATAADPPLEAQLVALTNADRAANGRGPLTVSAGLTNAAQIWSDYELRLGAIEHVPYPAVFLESSWLGWAENVGLGSSPSALNAAFMASPTHRANILGNYNRIGVGISVRGDGTEFVDVELEDVPGP